MGAGAKVKYDKAPGVWLVERYGMIRFIPRLIPTLDPKPRVFTYASCTRAVGRYYNFDLMRMLQRQSIRALTTFRVRKMSHRSRPRITDESMWCLVGRTRPRLWLPASAVSILLRMRCTMNLGNCNSSVRAYCHLSKDA